jgi:HEAT repeat protein/Na+/melibiose symporter-like transporter
MRAGPSNVEKIRTLPWRVTANAANTVFVQFTFFGSVFVLFLSELGFSKTQIGFELSLFPFFGLVALLVAPAVARIGYKRTFLTFWGARNVVTALLLLTPWVVVRFGVSGTLLFVTGIVAAFSLCRAVGETAWYPWAQEMIPNSIRGKFAATNQIFTTLVGLAAVSVAGFVVERSTDLSRFTNLIGAGVLFGLFSVWAYAQIPGGAPEGTGTVEGESHRDIWDAIHDGGFVSYLLGFSLVTLATVPMVSFLPLFMQEQVGLSEGQVVLLQNGTLVGGLLSSYLWGWAADRYGSKPVMLTGLLLTLTLPVWWTIMPRESDWSLSIAVAIAFIQGVGSIGWSIGSARILFVSVVPPEKKSDYMALYYACAGLVGGISQLVGGWILDMSQGVSGEIAGVALDPYTPLFLLGFVVSLAGLIVLQRTREAHAVGVAEFANIFLRGNPFQAMGSMLRYHQARDEHTAVVLTERLGQSRSRLTVEELLEALADPRFHVRFEAIIAVAHMRHDARLTAALVALLEGTEIALSVIAAWALGRIGDTDAVQPLRQALDSQYRSLQLHSARALGALDDTESIPLLSRRLAAESDVGLQLAYASALGQLRAPEATRPLLALLEATSNEGARMELALSLARIVGDERAFIRLFRQVNADTGMAVSRAVSGLRKRWRKKLAGDDEFVRLLTTCAATWGRDDLEAGSRLLAQIADMVGDRLPGSVAGTILGTCSVQLREHGARRPEYVLLAVHTLNVAWRPGALAHST